MDRGIETTCKAHRPRPAWWSAENQYMRAMGYNNQTPRTKLTDGTRTLSKVTSDLISFSQQKNTIRFIEI